MVSVIFKMISVTKSASVQLKRVLGSHAYMFFGAKGGGCNGFKYILDFADVVNGDDHVIDYGNFLIVGETGQLHNFTGLTLDFVTQGLNSEFVFINPNATTSCGCGESVAF